MVNKNNQNTSKQEISSLREDIDVLRKEIEAVEDKYLAVHRGESFWINSLEDKIDSLNYVIEAHRLVDMRQQNTIEALEDKIEALQKKINLLTEEAILGYQGTGKTMPIYKTSKQKHLGPKIWKLFEEGKTYKEIAHETGAAIDFIGDFVRANKAEMNAQRNL